MKWWQELIKQVVIFLIGSSGIVFLFQQYIKKRADIEINEHNVKFSQLHNKRGEVIAELYSKLADTHRAAGMATKLVEFSNEPSKTERFNSFVTAYNDFNIYFNRNKIFLSKDVISEIEAFNKKLMEQISGFDVYILQAHALRGPDSKAYEVWTNAAKEISKGGVLEIREKLEEELRKIIEV